MSDVQQLFDWEVPPYVRTSATSRQAAASVAAKTPRYRDKVLALLKREELTDEQIAERLGMRPNTARPRRIELLKDNLIVDAGRTITSSGRAATKWRAK